MITFRLFMEASPETIAKVRALYDQPGSPGEKAAAASALRRMGVAVDHEKPSSGLLKASEAPSRYGWHVDHKEGSDVFWKHEHHPDHTLYTNSKDHYYEHTSVNWFGKLAHRTFGRGNIRDLPHHLHQFHGNYRYDTHLTTKKANRSGGNCNVH